MRIPLSHIRKYRRSTLLAQRELAALVGLTSQHAFSEVETGAKRPGLEVAFACALALGAPLEDLFPNLALHVESQMLERAHSLLDALSSDSGRKDAAAYVAALIRRLTDHLEI